MVVFMLNMLTREKTKTNFCDIPGEGVLDDSWHSDFEPCVRINDAQNMRSVVLVPFNGSLIREECNVVSQMPSVL